MKKSKNLIDSVSAVFLDTNFLIYLVDTKSPHHKETMAYFRFLKENGKRFLTSSICLTEFAVQGDPRIFLSEAKISPFGFQEALLAAQLTSLFNSSGPKTSGQAQKNFVKDDLKILAQAHLLDVSYILSADREMGKVLTRLKGAGSPLKLELIDFSKIPVSAKFGVLPEI